MPNKSLSINLLKNKQESLFDQFTNWTLTIGRLLVILTELIALSAFLYRFSLDRQLIDLHAQIKQRQAFISSIKENEDKYRDLQNRLYLASIFSSSSMERGKILKDVLNSIPKGITLSNLALNKKSINMNANVQSTPSLTLFVDSLKKYPSIATVSLNNIKHKPSTNFITVSITATFKESQYDNIKQ